MNRNDHAAHLALQEEIHQLVIGAVEELIDEVTARPAHRAELIDVFATVMLESLSAYAEHLVKRSAAELGIENLEH